jgi:hypothetical protein
VLLPLLQERIRAKLGNSQPPAAAAAPGGGGSGGGEEEEELPADPDTLAAQLSESEAEADRCV